MRVQSTLSDLSSFNPSLRMKRACSTRSTLAACASLYWAVLLAQAEEPSSVFREYHHQAWTKAHGLPHNWVECILQTRDGYLWLGTRSGLVRFDGVQFARFAPSTGPEFQSEFCKALAEDSEGNLWVATKRGLWHLRDGTVRIFTTHDGLGHNEITALQAGANGGLWVGTGHGINWIANGKITHYPKASPPRDFTYSLHQDSQGALWAGFDAGLHSLDLKTGQFIEVWKTMGELPWQDYDIVRCLREDRAGHLWFGTDHGLYRKSQEQVKKFSIQEGLTDEKINAIYEDSKGILWVVAGNALHRAKANETFEVLDGFGLSEDKVNCIYEDREKNLWVGTRYGGLHRLQRPRLTTYTTRDGLCNDNVRSVCESRDGSLWIGTDAGISRMRDGRFTTLNKDRDILRVHADSLGKPNLDKLSFQAVHEDRADDLWLGAAERGIIFLQPVEAGFIYVGQTPGHHQTRSIYERRNGEIWIGQKEAITFLKRKNRGHLDDEGGRQHFFEFGDHWILRKGVVERRHSGRLWKYQNGMLALMDGEQAIRKYEKAEWAGMNGEDWNQLLPQGEPTHYDVRGFWEDAEGTLWIATAGGGLNRYRDGRFSAFTAKDGLANDFVLAIYGDAEGTLWLGTRDGLSRFKDGRFTTFTTRHGLLDNYIHGLVEDDSGCLWMSGSRGLFRVSRKDLNEVSDGKRASVDAIALDESDGLLTSETNGGFQPSCCKTRDGHLWFPTPRGLVRIDPARISKNELPPTVIIGPVRANDAPVYANLPAGNLSEPLGGTRLPSNSDSFASGDSRVRRSFVLPERIDLPPGGAQLLEIHYTATSFVAPEKVRFQYWLEGSDKQWRDAGIRRVAYYTNLRPGDYRFRVRACNNHGIWNEVGAAFAITVAPFYWETATFKGTAVAAVLLAGSAIGLGLHRWRLVYVRRIHAMEKAEEKKSALAEERKRIARDLHDQIGAQLTQIALAGNLASFPQVSTPTAGLPTNAVAGLSQRALRSLREIVWSTDSTNDTVEHLVDYLGNYAGEFLETTGLTLRLLIPESIPASPLDALARHNVVLAVKEALSNAVNHSKASALLLQFSSKPDGWSLTVEDNGCGFVLSEARDLGNGLRNMRERVESIGGSFHVQSQPGTGTRLVIVMPK